MGVIAKQTCPYCKTTSVAFTAVYGWVISGNNRRVVFKCGSCHEAVLREYIGPHDLANLGGGIENYQALTLGRQWPIAPSGAAPKDSPENVAKFFEQGTSSLEVGNFDAAGMMFRKALESATKVLDPEATTMPLIKRINALADCGKLTADMAQWAHEVRIGGNEAAHDDEPFSENDASDLRNFVENFLRYAFTMPSAVRRREGRSETAVTE